MAGSSRFSLPDGTTSAVDEHNHLRVYRFDRTLDLGFAGEARVAVDVTGNLRGLTMA